MAPTLRHSNTGRGKVDVERNAENPSSPLYTDRPLDNDLKVVKSKGSPTPLEMSNKKIRTVTPLDITGNLDVDGDISVRGDIKSNRLVIDDTGDITLDAAGDISLDAGGSDVNFVVGGTTRLTWNAINGLTMYSLVDLSDYFRINMVLEHGETVFSTRDDSGGNAGHMRFQPQGDIRLQAVTGNVALDATDKLYFDGGGNTFIQESSADVLRLYSGGNITFEATGGSDTVVAAQRTVILAPNQGGGGGNLAISTDVTIPATNKLYFDGGSDTYISESTADALLFKVGGDSLLVLSEDGAEGNQAWFKASAVGFTQGLTTYNASDTDVEFFTTNKKSLTFGSGNITDMNIYFPDVSANVLLKLTQDGTGSRTVTNWKSFDQAGGNESTVKWAGGSAPTLSTGANAVDIISFYWDNTNHIAYGVASLNFS